MLTEAPHDGGYQLVYYICSWIVKPEVEKGAYLHTKYAEKILRFPKFAEKIWGNNLFEKTDKKEKKKKRKRGEKIFFET